MPRTAPTVDGTPVKRRVSFRWIDASGDQRSDAVSIVDPAITDAEIEALAAAAAAVSNADLWAIEVTQVYSTVPDASNAVAAYRGSIYNNVVTLTKHATDASKRFYVPAPTDTIMIADADEIDPASVPLGDLFTAILAVFGAGYSVVSARYTERREINNATKI